MKIVRVDSPLDMRPARLALMADSTLRPDRRPLFLPEGDWECQVRVAIRIDRLGKAVSRKFAGRYYSELAPVNYLRPLGQQPWPDMTDDALVIGKWEPAGDLNLTMAEESASFKFDRDAFDSLLAHLSEHTTFKTGDIVILPDVMLRYKPRLDLHVEVLRDGDPALEFNIK